MITEWSPYQAIMDRITFRSKDTFLTTIRGRKKTENEIVHVQRIDKNLLTKLLSNSRLRPRPRV